MDAGDEFVVLTLAPLAYRFSQWQHEAGCGRSCCYLLLTLGIALNLAFALVSLALDDPPTGRSALHARPLLDEASVPNSLELRPRTPH